MNWAALWTGPDEENADVEICPICHNDSFLVKVTRGPLYIRSVISGVTTNVTTGEQLLRSIPPPPPKKTRRRKIYQETLEEFEERQNKAQEDWETKYLELLNTMPAEMAAVHAKRETPERLFVWSDEVNN